MVEHEADAVAALAGLDMADEQHVIAGAMHRVMAAFEPRDAAFDQRRVGGAEAERNAVEAIGMGSRERRASSIWSCASTLIA